MDFQLLADLLGTEVRTKPAEWGDQWGYSEIGTVVPVEGRYAKQHETIGNWELWHTERGGHNLRAVFPTLKELIISSMWTMNPRGMPETLNAIEPALTRAGLKLPIQRSGDSWLFGDIAEVSTDPAESEFVIQLSHAFPIPSHKRGAAWRDDDQKFRRAEEWRAASIVFIAICDRMTS